VLFSCSFLARRDRKNSINIQRLNGEFGVSGQLSFFEAQGGLPFLQVSNQNASALISLYAGQVLSFQPVNATEDMLFVSSNAYFHEEKAIKGGIPICWPWFGDVLANPSLPAHGFVRNNFWRVTHVDSLENNDTGIQLEFVNTPKTSTYWPDSFRLFLKIVIGHTLTVELATINSGHQVFAISEALHTYFKVADVQQITVGGLENTDFLDKTEGFSQKHQRGAVKVSTEMDRIYLNTSASIVIHDPILNRQIKISSSGNRHVVLWNPWFQGSTTLADLHPDDYHSFICVEMANALPHSVEIAPGQSHSLTANFSIMPHSQH